MKVLVLLGVCFLTACGSYTTLEQLEDQAMLTGDWSAVESRERIMAKRRARSAKQCPKGYISYCESRMSAKRCTCVQNEIISALMYGY